MGLVTVTFDEWWQRPENQERFWQRTYASNAVDHVAVSLREKPRSIFRQILQKLKGYHDQDIGYGNLIEGVRIDGNNQVHLDPNPNIPLAESSAAIKQDFLDFEQLVTWVENLITIEKKVQPAYSSTKFHELCRLLDNDTHYRTGDELRRFGFFMRNNPLFLDETAKYLFFKKVLTLKEYNVAVFRTNVPLSDIQDWCKDVRNTVLLNVRNHRPTTGSGNPTNQSGNPVRHSGGSSTSQSGMHRKRKHRSVNPKSHSGMCKKKTSQSGNPTSRSGNPTIRRGNPINQGAYGNPDGSIVFFRNCLGHVRLENGADRYHDAKILLALEADLPKVIPVWFYELVCLDEATCISMCGYSWIEFLSKRPTVFT